MRNKKVDEEKILSKIDILDSYLEELDEIKINDFEVYVNSIEKKRSIERLFQICIETAIDVCNILVSNLKLGIPSDEDSLFEKLKEKKVISNEMSKILINMKGLRNHLVHKYEDVKDERVFENLEKLEDFEKFKEEVLWFLKNIGKYK